MALYNTVPAEESTRLAPPKTTTTKSIKGLAVVAAVAAVASFDGVGAQRLRS